MKECHKIKCWGINWTDLILLILCKVMCSKCKSSWKIFQKSVKCTLVNIIEWQRKHAVSQLPWNEKRKANHELLWQNNAQWSFMNRVVTGDSWIRLWGYLSEARWQWRLAHKNHSEINLKVIYKEKIPNFNQNKFSIC